MPRSWFRVQSACPLPVQMRLVIRVETQLQSRQVRSEERTVRDSLQRNTSALHSCAPLEGSEQTTLAASVSMLCVPQSGLGRRPDILTEPGAFPFVVSADRPAKIPPTEIDAIRQVIAPD